MRQKMDDRSKNPQSMGNVQQNQRQTQHTKPFFYVQPASQPYYNMYHHHNQWHMSNLYNHYGLPGSGGYPFGRFSPYMSPYPYMQYPGGYVVTHAPHMHPMDYRRMYEPPRFQPPLGHEHMFQHDHVFHHEQQQHHAEVQRETACSEVQTDPSDSLNKLIECLGKLQTNEIQGSDKELDSGVVSQASGIFCPDDRERKGSKEVVGAPDMHSHSASPGWCKIEGSHVQSSPMATLFSVNDSTAAVYDGESSRSLGDLGHREGWAVDSDHEPPLDSSSVHEEHDENPDLLQHHLDEDESLHRCSSENICLLSAVSRLDDSLIPRPGETDDHVEDGTHTDGTARTQGQGSNLQSLQLLQTPPPLASDSQGLDDVKPVDDMLAVPDEGFDVLSNLDADLSGQISSLPFHEVLTAGTLQTDNPADSAMLSGNIQPSLSSALLASMANSPTRQHYYPYYPLQTAHERLSVLSPSLDELSSRDEMFSTDLDELDLYPRHRVYPGQRFSAAEVQKVCSKSKKLMCACCGSSLLKGAGASSRIKGHHHSPKAYIDDQAVDTDEADEREPHRSARTCEERSHPARVLLKMPSVPRKRQSLPLHSRFPEEHGCRRSQHREAAATREQPVDPELVLVGSEPGHYEDHVMQRETETDAGDQQHRMCKDRQCREGASTTDLCSWETGGAKPRRTPHSLLQERLAVKKVRSNQLVFQDEVNEEEQPRLHRGKDMEATSTTTQHAYRVGLFGPNQAHGLQPGQGPRDPGCYGAQCPEDQTSHTHPPPNSQHHHHQQQNHQPHHHIQHSRPFFYVQPSQPYPPPLPYQWPMPMPYSPYCSFPGMGGYGVMMPNPFQAGPYMEHPGYVLAQSQLHLADYRRMINPHYHTTHHPQTMAYHARRLRYQHSAPPAREMINCEVQTDTLSAAESQLSEVAESASRIKVQTNSDSYTSCAGPQSLSNTSTIKEVTSKSADYQGRIISAATSANIPVDARSTALQKGSFVFQDEIEEVRIECGSSLTGLKIHTSLSQEADVMATTTQRVAHSVSGTGGDWVQLFSSLHPPANGSVQHSEAHGTGQQHQQEEGGMGPCQDEVEDDDERSLRVCPDIPLMAKAPSNDWSTEKFSAIEECNSDLVNTLAEPPGNSVSSIDPKVVDQSHNADSPHLLNDGEEVNVANQYLEELKNVQCLEMVSAWSVKAVVPYEPSPMLTIQQGSTQLPRESLSPVMEVTVAEEGPIVEEVHVMEEVLMSEEDVQKVLEGLVVKEVGPVVQEAPVREAVSMAQIPVNEVVPRLEEISRMEEPLPAIQSPDKTDAPPSPQTSQKRAEMSDIDHQDTSFEALPTHLSATWLSDWGNMCYYSKLPCNVEEQRQILRCSPLKPSSPRVKTNLTRELNVTHCGAVNMVSHGLKGDGCRHRGMEDGRSYSDHECSANRSLNQNTLTPGGSKRDRICARCLIMKRRASKTTGSPGVEAHVIKQQGVSIPLWEESVLAQTCAACKCIPRRRVARKGSGSDVQSGFHNRETSEGETSENSFQARPGTPKPRDIKDPRRPLDPKPQFFMKSHSGTCSVAPQSKLREKNCSCEEPHHHGRPAAMWVGQTRPWRHHHGNVIREQNEENLGVAVSTPLQDKWRNQEPQYLTTQGWQQEKLRAVTSTADYTDGSRNVHRPRSLNTQKKHVSQSQGMIRKDNRC